MPTWTLWGQPYAEVPATTHRDGKQGSTLPIPKTGRPVALKPSELVQPGGKPSSFGLKLLLSFDAECDDDARAFFIHCQDHGVPDKAPKYTSEKPRWRYRGAPHYHAVQGRRLGVAPRLVSRCDQNAESKCLQSALGQLSRLYHGLRGGTGDFKPNQPDVQTASATLAAAEDYVTQLHCLAAASTYSMDEAYEAWGLRPPTRNFTVVCRSDVPEPVEVTPSTESQPETPPTKADGKSKQTAGVK